jgi:hypothetical protein
MDKRRKLEAGALALLVAEASTLLNHETKVAKEVPAVAVAMAAAAGGSNYSQETKLSRKGEAEK